MSAQPWVTGPRLAVALCLLATACESPYATRTDAAPAPPAAAANPPPADAAPLDGSLGDGFVVWESNRGGAWRLWRRDLDGSPPRRLTPDEAGRHHCCAHIAPDGSGIAYLSLPPGQEAYPESGGTGVLRWIRPDGGGERVLAEAAKTYGEHRAAVWQSPRHLIHLGGDGRTRRLDLADGSTRLLVEAPPEDLGWLIDSTLRHATTGWPSFSPYDAAARRVRPRRKLGGCQPYFTHDGRWGFWTSGAGGPIDAIELSTRRLTSVLRKSDPRLPAGQGYLYFPMFSADARLFVVGASRDEHSHHTSNYDIFLAETDPRTLEILGPLRRVTEHPATDRFPDVWAAPLALGRHVGEAPFTLTAELPEGVPWRFTIAGADAGSGSTLRHTFPAPGSFEVGATRGGETRRGRVTVSAPRPPRAISAEPRRGREVLVAFDEEVDATAARVAFASGREVAGWRLTPDHRSLVVELTAELDAADVLHLTGMVDRAQVPQAMPAASLAIAPPRWPSDRRGLVFLWRTEDAANEVVDAETGTARTCLVNAGGRAYLDRHRAMVLAGGTFDIDGESAAAVLEGCRKTSGLAVEATLTPARHAEVPGRILTYSSGNRQRNFTLGQEGDRLVFRLRVSTTGPNADRPQIELAQIPIGRPSHVLVTYRPGRLVAYLDGEQVLETDVAQSGFFHWKPRRMLFGNESQKVPRPWHGSVEGVAIYNRFVDAEEAAENHRRYAAERAERPHVEPLRRRLRLARRSEIPTLEKISPYREALAVFEYESEADGERLRVAHRVILDGETLPLARRGIGRAFELVLEPFDAHPELASLYLADTLEAPGRLYFDAAIEP